MHESKIRNVQYVRSFPEISNLFEISDKHGQGTFASVFAVKDKQNPDFSRTYALKMLIPTVEVRRIENEVRILRRLGLFLVDFGLAHSEEFGDIDERWERKFEPLDNQKHLDEKQLKSNSSTVSDQSSCLSTSKSKESNINLNHKHNPSKLDQKVTLKNSNKSIKQHSSSTSSLGGCVCGFRLAVCRGCRHLPRAPAARRGGTLGFRPPEVMMRHAGQTTSVDIWAVGVIFLSFLSGRYPFIKADDDLDVLHAFTHLVSYERMQLSARSIGRRILLDPKPQPMDTTESPASWLKAQCITIRKFEKKFIGLPPLLSNITNESGVNKKKSFSANNSSNIKLPATHVFPHIAYDLLARLLEPHPRKRISAYDALRHPYFSNQSYPRGIGERHTKRPKTNDVDHRPQDGDESRAKSDIDQNVPFVPRAQFC